VALSACGGQSRPSRAPVDQTGAYLAAPTLAAAERQEDGAVKLLGHAPAGALVRLRAPGGGGASVLASDDGHWVLTLPPADTPRLYAIEAELQMRVVRGEGAIAVMPAPGPAGLTLRAGFASLPAGHGQPHRLQLITFDFDGGGAAVGGFAPPKSRVRLTVDGGTVGATDADAQGRFAVLAVVRTVAPGSHEIRVDTPQGLAIDQSVEVAEASLAPDQPFAATRSPGGWRVSWQLPGGGGQSTLVFDNASASAAATPTGR